MKITFFTILSVIIVLNISAFGSKESGIEVNTKKVVGLILEKPGIGDESVNDSCYIGLQEAAEEGLVTLRVKTAQNIDDIAIILTNFVEEKVDLIYMIGEKNKELLTDASKLYPNITFVGVDINFLENELKPNLYGITFKEQDGGFLAGLVAGSLTYKYNNRHSFLNDINRVGIILGKNSPEIKRYELGFYAGVKKVNPPCEIISININDLNDPEKGFNAVQELKGKGVDIIFSIAGNSNSGVFKSAEESDVLIIAANKDNSSESINVLTSVEKKLSVSTYLITKDIIEGKYVLGSNISFGLLENAIALSPYYNFDKYIPKDLRNLIKEMTLKLIKTGTLIPDSIENIIFDVEKVPTIE